MVAALLALAAALSFFGHSWPAVALMTIAMGAENAVFEREGEVSIGLTYMTGTLVKLGQKITAALLGGNRFAWIPYGLLWLGLVTGALAGALSHARIGLGGLWIAAIAAATLAYMAERVGRSERAQPLPA